MNHRSNEMEARLDRELCGEASGPPAIFLSKVRGRRRRIVLARAGAGAVIAMLLLAAVLTVRVTAPAPPTGPLVRGDDRPGPTGVDGGGPGAAGWARGVFIGPGPAAAAPVRMGDGPDSERVRALLEA